MITEHKVMLIDCLRRDHSYILQFVHEKKIVTDRKYDQLKHLGQPEPTIIDLIDHVIGNGEKSCSQFIKVLKQPDVVSTFPQLKEMIRNW